MNELNKFEEAMLQLERKKLHFDEYKFWVEDTSRFSERRTRVPSTYVTINSVILGAIAFLLKETKFVIGWEAAVIMPLLLAGIIACLAWSQNILNYKMLVNLRINRLRAMEELPEMEGRLKMYHAEDVLLPRTGQGERPKVAGLGLYFADSEGLLPWVLLIVYVCSLLAILASLLARLF